MRLTDITKGSEYDLSLFSDEKVVKMESQIVSREGEKGFNTSLRKDGCKSVSSVICTLVYTPNKI